MHNDQYHSDWIIPDEGSYTMTGIIRVSFHTIPNGHHHTQRSHQGRRKRGGGWGGWSTNQNTTQGETTSHLLWIMWITTRVLWVQPKTSVQKVHSVAYQELSRSVPQFDKWEYLKDNPDTNKWRMLNQRRRRRSHSQKVTGTGGGTDSRAAKFHPWPEIEQFHHVVHKVKAQPLTLTYRAKIKCTALPQSWQSSVHGTNAAVNISVHDKTIEVLPQSRNKFLLEEDHHGFAAFTTKNRKFFETVFRGFPSIQSLVLVGIVWVNQSFTI